MGFMSSYRFAVVLACFLTLSPLAHAHGSFAHSLNELAEHIDGHILNLEPVVKLSNPAPELVQNQIYQIQIHAQQYRSLARKLIKERHKMLTARTLEQISRQLIQAIREGDLRSSLKFLKHIRILVQPIA